MGNNIFPYMEYYKGGRVGLLPIFKQQVVLQTTHITLKTTFKAIKNRKFNFLQNGKKYFL